MQEIDMGADDKTGRIAVIFVSQRNDNDRKGYSSAGHKMEMLAKQQPGYVAYASARGIGGLGITISYWETEDHAKAWRDHPVHAEVREMGRGRWYDSYHIDVAEVQRSYNWTRDKTNGMNSDETGYAT